MCFRNLHRRRLRTFLCVLGITLATSLIITIGATTSRYVSIIKEMHTYFSGKVVIVSKGTIVIEAFPISTGNLFQTMVDKLKQNISEVKDAIPMLFIFNFEGTIEISPKNFTVGIPYGNWSVLVGPTPLKSGGSWPSENAYEAVIGSSLSDQFNLSVGDSIKLKTYDLVVTGVLDTSSALLSRSILVSLDIAQKIYNYYNLVNLIVVEPKEGVNPKELAGIIETRIENVEALTEDETTNLAQPLISNIETWALGITTVLFILSMIFVTAVSIMNVSERRRDFATLDAIGAPKTFIYKMVIMETGLMGLMGGLSGILLGSILAIIVASIYTSIPISLFLPGIFDITPPTLMLEVLVSTVSVSCVAGIIPSIAAAKMKIAEVLKVEY